MGLSDYELYKVLEANQYKTTEKNLQLLKEGLINGKYYLSIDDNDIIDCLLESIAIAPLNEDYKKYNDRLRRKYSVEKLLRIQTMKPGAAEADKKEVVKGIGTSLLAGILRSRNYYIRCFICNESVSSYYW